MKRHRIFLIGLGIGQLACYLFLLSLGNLKEHIIACFGGFFSAFLLYGGTLFVLGTGNQRIQDTHASPTMHCSGSHKRFCLIAILCFSVCFRMAMWLTLPSLSDDIYRYLWEGKILSLGINPYQYAPADSALEHLRDQEIYPNINNKDLATIYPPLSLYLFRISMALCPTIHGMKATFVFFDLLTIFVLLLTLRAENLDLTRVAVYAWNPLVITEFSGSGHLDSSGIFFLVLTLYLFVQRRAFTPVISLSLSFLSKLFPLMFLPFILTTRKLLNVSLFALVVGIFYFPFLSAGGKIGRSLVIYGREWAFNASLYEAFLWSVHSPLAARGVSAALFIVIALGLFVRGKLRSQKDSEESIYSVGFVIFGSLFLLTPVLHPWYLCWIVPFLVMRPNRAWILFTGSVFLSYWVLKDYIQTGVWEESSAIKTMEYLPFYVLLIGDFLWGKISTGRLSRESSRRP